jgi:hypothetical protein
VVASPIANVVVIEPSVVRDADVEGVRCVEGEGTPDGAGNPALFVSEHGPPPLGSWSPRESRLAESKQGIRESRPKPVSQVE